jgi:hypothetical protein
MEEAYRPERGKGDRFLRGGLIDRSNTQHDRGVVNSVTENLRAGWIPKWNASTTIASLQKFQNPFGTFGMRALALIIQTL